MKRILSYSLILSFLILWAPKEWMHDCDHDHQANEISKVEVNKKCYACDYDIHFLSIPTLKTELSVYKPFCQLDENRQFIILSSQDRQLSLRGPPNDLFFSI